MKAMTPVLVSGGNSHSHFPVAARVLGLLLAGSLLAGCVSTYELPQHVTEPAMLGGDVIYREGEDRWAAALRVNYVDEKRFPWPTSRFQRKLDNNHLFQVEPGEHTLHAQRVRFLVGSNKADGDYLPAINVVLSPGKTYRLTGKVIVGSAIAYWIEEAESGTRITEVLYDPAQWAEELMEMAKQPPAPIDHAPLDTNIAQHFASKPFLLPGRDCFSMVRETLVNSGEMLMSFLANMGSSGAGVAVGDYGYSVYKPICIDVEAGHHYQVKRVYFDRKDGRFVPKGTRDFYQVWDLTDERVVLEIRRKDLGLTLTNIE